MGSSEFLKRCCQYLKKSKTGFPIVLSKSDVALAGANCGDRLWVLQSFLSIFYRKITGYFWNFDIWFLVIYLTPLAKEVLNHPLQCGLGWLQSISQRQGPGSKWDHFLASFVIPTNRSNALKKLTTKTLSKLEKVSFERDFVQLSQSSGSLKYLKYQKIYWSVWHRKPGGDPILTPHLISESWTFPF